MTPIGAPEKEKKDDDDDDSTSSALYQHLLNRKSVPVELSPVPVIKRVSPIVAVVVVVVVAVASKMVQTKWRRQ